MLNYVKSEVYKHLNRKYIYITVAATSALFISVFFLLRFVAHLNTFTPVLENSSVFLESSVYFVLIILGITCCEEHKYTTLKNVISFGFPRKKLYMGKLLSTWVICFITAIAILTCYLLSGFIILSPSSDFTFNILWSFLYRFILAVPLWMGAASLGVLLCFIFKNETVLSLIYSFSFLLVSKVIEMLGDLIDKRFYCLMNFIITPKFKLLNSNILTNKNIEEILFIGIAYIVVPTILGTLYIKKAEYK